MVRKRKPETIASGNHIAELQEICEEAPQAYKDIERVKEDMLHENMITLVVSFNHLVTYKG